MHCAQPLRSKQQQYASLQRHQQRSVDTYKYFSHLLNKTLHFFYSEDKPNVYWCDVSNKKCSLKHSVTINLPDKLKVINSVPKEMLLLIDFRLNWQYHYNLRSEFRALFLFNIFFISINNNFQQTAKTCGWYIIELRRPSHKHNSIINHNKNDIFVITVVIFPGINKRPRRTGPKPTAARGLTEWKAGFSK